VGFWRRGALLHLLSAKSWINPITPLIKLFGRLPWQRLRLQPRLRTFAPTIVVSSPYAPFTRVYGRFVHPIPPSTCATSIRPTTTRRHASISHYLATTVSALLRRRDRLGPRVHTSFASRQTTCPRRKSCHGHLLIYRLFASTAMKLAIS
jgi:hypothetical protein